MTRFTVKPTSEAACRAMADRFVEAATTAIEENGIFRVALTGGGTPKTVYPMILEPRRRDAVDWSRVEFFWGDERTVPPDDPQSNFGVAYGMFVSQLPNVRPDRVHRMQAEAPDLDAAALSYESELRLAFGARGQEPPTFDLIWLGMGPDGHTASLFPGSTAVDETERWVVGTWAPFPQAWRMTLTFPVLLAGRQVIFVVEGANKVDAIRAIRAGGSDLPAARVDGPQVEWLIDAAAAGEDPGAATSEEDE
ncbi:MAG TPA: 6-phosphogluconolactonase [Candidatus Angelobacter sp.]|nr:6-phosphogluconolactonase [Candidatus Angelobacter sp.]